MRETALSLTKQEVADEHSQAQLLALMRRAIQSLQECDIEDADQRAKNVDVVNELSMATAWLDQVSP